MKNALRLFTMMFSHNMIAYNTQIGELVFDLAEKFEELQNGIINKEEAHKIQLVSRVQSLNVKIFYSTLYLWIQYYAT